MNQLQTEINKVETLTYSGPDRRACPYDCDRSERAADRAVHKVFNILGVDLDSPKDVERFRSGLRFGEALQKYAEKGIMAVVAVTAVAIVGATVYGVAYKIKIMVLNIK